MKHLIVVVLLASLLFSSGCVVGLVTLAVRDHRSEKRVMAYKRCTECGAWVTERLDGDGWVVCNDCGYWVEVPLKKEE